jgi:hypothetical protein
MSLTHDFFIKTKKTTAYGGGHVLMVVPQEKRGG